MATVSKARRVLLFPIDLIFYPLAWTYEAALSLPSYQHFVDILVESSADIVTRVLSHPAVANAIAFAIAGGMNKFLLQPDLDEHVKVITLRVSLLSCIFGHVLIRLGFLFIPCRVSNIRILIVRS